MRCFAGLQLDRLPDKTSILKFCPFLEYHGLGKTLLKASVRAKVEHLLRYITQVYGYRKVHHRGLAENTTQLHLLAALSNLVTCQKLLFV